jgi:hypothetical protein
MDRIVGRKISAVFLNLENLEYILQLAAKVWSFERFDNRKNQLHMDGRVHLLFRPLSFFVFLLLGSSVLTAQDALILSEDFNDCAIPGGWTVEQTGNPDASWYVGQPQNTNSDGTTIDGSCMLIFDDDATGNGSDPWTARLVSPTFDPTSWTTVQLSMDIHFRNYDGSSSLKILVFDGVEYQEVAVYQGAGDQTGTQFSEFATFSTDLSFYANPNMRIAIEFDDGGIWAWWAGVDNIEINGGGFGTQVLQENFNACGLPPGWLSWIQSGDAEWQFGLVDNPNTPSTSINGTCFAYFDDDIQGQAATPSTAFIATPVFDGTSYANYWVEMDVILRRYTDLEELMVGVMDEATGEISWAASYLTDLGGPNFSNFVHEVVDLSAFRKAEMRVVIGYHDGGSWGWWAGIDNLKVIADGQINDLCTNAFDLELDAPCLEGDNTLALFSGPAPSCSEEYVGSLWYNFLATSNGWAQLEVTSNFNDALTVFAGDCSNLQEVACTNYDEFGFTGETLIWEVTTGTTYRVRLHGDISAFGRYRGQSCLSVTMINELPSPPANDLCAWALPLEIDGDCVEATNLNATFEGPQPSRNDKSKADIWFSFTPATDDPLLISSAADFADVLTVYSGDCGSLEEVACNELGQELKFKEPVAGTNYLLQLSGYFATLEGGVCVQVETLEASQVSNPTCQDALLLSLDGSCQEVTNNGNSFTGPPASCDVYLDHSVWFEFTAPVSRQVQLMAETDFVHSLSVFGGTCNNLQEILCRTNPQPCTDDIWITGLAAGTTYWVRISSIADVTGMTTSGTVCLSVQDAEGLEPYEPIAVSGYTECFGNGSGVVFVLANGGQGELTWSGTTSGAVIQEGEVYLTSVSDEAGCTAVFSGMLDCAPTCDMSIELTATGINDCPDDFAGLLTPVITNGSGGYEYAWSNGTGSELAEDLAGGYYRVTVTDTLSGCMGVAGAWIEGPPPYAFEILYLSAASPDEGGAITVSFSGGTAPYTFNWTLNGTTVSNEQNPTALAPGEYILTVTDATGCTFTSEAIIVNAPNAVADISRASWRLFPNPAADQVCLEMTSSVRSVREVQLFDGAGRMVRVYEPDFSLQEMDCLDLKGLAAGVYFVRVFQEGQAQVEKLVIQPLR